MDPVSVGGLSLGITGVIFQAFAGCVKAYQLYEDVKGMPSAYQHLRVRLFMEQARLLRWGDKLGLIEDRLETTSQILRLNRNVVVDVLLEVQSALTGCAALQSKIEPRCSDDAQEFPGYEANSQTDPRETLLKKTLALIELSKLGKKRIAWVLGKQHDFELLVTKLIHLNDSIEGLLDRQMMEDLQTSQFQANMLALQLHDKVDQLLEFSKALDFRQQMSVALSAEDSASETSILAMPDKAGSEIARLAKFKARDIQISHKGGPYDHLSLNNDALRITNAITSDRFEGCYEGIPVCVEWREPLAGENLRSIGSLHQVVLDRIRRLAALLNIEDKPPEFRTPFCVGYIEHPDKQSCRYGLVYKMPQSAGVPTRAPVSLRELLTGPRPSLTERVALSHILTRCIMYLHSVNWLHKGFRSSNVVFCSTPTAKYNLLDPLLMGFDYARPDFEAEITEVPPAYTKHDVYRHPSTLGSDRVRTAKSHDIYSLGVVMVEIAHWRTIDEVLRLNKDETHINMLIKSARKSLLSSYHLEKIRGCAGDIYKEAVQTCLEGGSSLGIGEDGDESDHQVSVIIQRTFSEKVVERLGSTMV